MTGRMSEAERSVAIAAGAGVLLGLIVGGAGALETYAGAYIAASDFLGVLLFLSALAVSVGLMLSGRRRRSGVLLMVAASTFIASLIAFGSLFAPKG